MYGGTFDKDRPTLHTAGFKVRKRFIKGGVVHQSMNERIISGPSAHIKSSNALAKPGSPVGPSYGAYTTRESLPNRKAEGMGQQQS